MSKITSGQRIEFKREKEAKQLNRHSGSIPHDPDLMVEIYTLMGYVGRYRYFDRTEEEHKEIRKIIDDQLIASKKEMRKIIDDQS